MRTSMSLYASAIFARIVSRTVGMRVPTASTRTMSSTRPRLRRSANVIATTPAGLSGAAPAAVPTQPVVYSPAPIISAETGIVEEGGEDGDASDGVNRSEATVRGTTGPMKVTNSFR